jgi:uncharacterized membrane protein
MARNINKVVEDHLTGGQRVADFIALLMGSWAFILIQSLILIIWLIFNITAWVNHWDPYPFILLNLVLSFQAAYATPIILMSQNRQAQIDRIKSELDFETNVKAEQEIQEIHKHLEQIQDQKMEQIMEKLNYLEGLLTETRRDKK